MKKTLLAAFAMLFATWSITIAQGDPVKDMKKASRNVGSYKVDNVANKDKLDEAKVLIDGAIQSDLVNQTSRGWQTYAEVYTEVLNDEVRELATDQEKAVVNGDAPTKIVDGYTKAYSLGEKAYEKKDALKGLGGILNNISYVSSVMLRSGDFTNAFYGYEALIKGNKFVVDKGEAGLYEEEKDFQDQYYWAALSAFSAEMLTESAEYFQHLIDEGYDSPDIYSGMFEVKKSQGDQAGADEVLVAGVAKYPEDKGLMFAEINSALAKGDLDNLINKLENALVTEPDNITIPATLGNVYDQLYQDAITEKDFETAETYYAEAKKNFAKALEIDDTYFDALYMMGAVEYNRAAQLAAELNELADDYSKEGTAKYDAKKEEMLAQFDAALPYFQKAEMQNATDMNTLVALREIYARKDQLDLSEQYKQKIKSLPAQEEE